MLYWTFLGMKINVLKGERFEVNPEEINVTFDDVKGVSLSLFFVWITQFAVSDTFVPH